MDQQPQKIMVVHNFSGVMRRDLRARLSDGRSYRGGRPLRRLRLPHIPVNVDSQFATVDSQGIR